MENLEMITIKDKEQKITKQLKKYFKERTITEIKITSQIKGNYIYFLGYAITEGKSFTHAYNMLTCSIYGEEIYKNKNVVCGESYNINDVVNNTLNYFKHTLKELTK